MTDQMVDGELCKLESGSHWMLCLLLRIICSDRVALQQQLTLTVQLA